MYTYTHSVNRVTVLHSTYRIAWGKPLCFERSNCFYNGRNVIIFEEAHRQYTICTFRKLPSDDGRALLLKKLEREMREEK